MFRWWQARMLTQLATLVAFGYLFWLGWQHLGPRKPEVGPLREQVAAKVLPTIVEDIRESRQHVHTAALLHLVNDPSDYLTDQLRCRIEQSGIVDLRDRTFLEKVRKVLDLRQPSVGVMSEAMECGISRKADAVIFGTVNRFESGPDGAELDLDLSVVGLDPPQPLLTRRYQVTTPLSYIGKEAQKNIAGLGGTRRFLAWLVIVLLLPVFSIQFIRAMVRKESNRANAFVLGIYTVADAILAWLMVGASFSGWLPIVVFIAAIASALAYNIFVMTFALRLER